MASLTPLSKGLIALAVIGGMASAVWHLGLKDMIGSPSGAVPPPAQTPPSVQTAPAPTPSAAPQPEVKPVIPAQVASPAPTPVPRSSPAPVPPPAAVVEDPKPAPEPPAAQPPAPPPSVAKHSTASPESKLTPAENAEAGRKAMVAGNFTQARIHFELAVQGGDGSAACHLGEMTLKGQGGITASQEKAAVLFQQAQAHNIICFAASR